MNLTEMISIIYKLDSVSLWLLKFRQDLVFPPDLRRGQRQDLLTPTRKLLEHQY